VCITWVNFRREKRIKGYLVYHFKTLRYFKSAKRRGVGRKKSEKRLKKRGGHGKKSMAARDR